MIFSRAVREPNHGRSRASGPSVMGSDNQESSPRESRFETAQSKPGLRTPRTLCRPFAAAGRSSENLDPESENWCLAVRFWHGTTRFCGRICLLFQRRYIHSEASNHWVTGSHSCNFERGTTDQCHKGKLKSDAC